MIDNSKAPLYMLMVDNSRAYFSPLLGVKVSTFMFLVSLEQVLSTAYILSQLIRVNSSLHIISPACQIFMISQERLKLVWVIQGSLSLFSLNVKEAKMSIQVTM